MIAENYAPPRNLPCRKLNNQSRADKNKKATKEKEEAFESSRLSENKITWGRFMIANAKQHCQQMKQVLLKLMSKDQEISPSQEKLDDGKGLESAVATLQQEREQLQFQVKAMKSAFRELSIDNEMQFNSLQKNVGRLKEERENLQVRLQELEYTNTEQQNRLKMTVEEQREVIRTLKSDLIGSQKEREGLIVQVRENKVFAEEYQHIMKEIERRHTLKSNKNINPQMCKLICHNTVLTEKLDQSKILINTQKAHSKQLQLQCQQLQTYIRRFEEELQACTSVISEPKQLKQKVATLKSNYVDNPKIEYGLETFETEYESKIRALEKKIARLTRITRNDKNIRKRMEQKLSTTVSTFTKREKEYIKLLQVEIYKTKQMERELKKANLKVDNAYTTTLENSTRSACSSVATEVDEEMVQFYKWHCNISEPSDPGATDKGNTESLSSRQTCETSASENSTEDLA